MADPELSLQSMLMVAVVIGRAKTGAYVGAVALFSICAGLFYGAWVDGVDRAPLALALVVILVLMGCSLALLRHLQRAAAPA